MPLNSSHAPPRRAPRRPARRLVLATSNPGKLREFQCLLDDVQVAGAPYQLVTLEQAGLPSPQETGHSFLANAMLKAEHAAALGGSAALADDSGLEVDALQGAPGIYSARYANGGQEPGQSIEAANNAKLMRQLAGVPFARRTARYRCALVLIDAHLHAPLIAEDFWDGYILEAPLGTGGFGYDAYFWLPEHQLTAAQLKPEDKNRLSHRGKAMRALREALLGGGAAQ